MKTDERIFRYLAGLMRAEEVRQFEDDLRTSEEINAELKKIKEQFESFRAGNEVDGSSQYFNNLIPTVRARISKRKSKKIPQSIKYLAPAFTLIILYFLIPFRSGSLFEKEISELNDSSQTELLYLLDDSPVFYENNTMVESAISEELQDAEISRIDAQYFNTDDLLINLSDEEINDIYNTLLNKKIL